MSVVRANMLHTSFLLLFIYFEMIFTVSAFSSGSVISKGPALIRNLYCGQVPLHRAPFHLNMSRCGGYCHASMNTDKFDIHVSDTTYWDSVINVTVRSVAGSPYNLTGFAVAAINSEGTVIGKFFKSDNVTVAVCNQGTEVEGSTALHAHAQYNRTAFTLKWTGPGHNFNDIKFRVWIVHSHDTIFYLESQPVRSLHNGSSTINLLSMLSKLLRSKSATDTIMDTFEKGFVYRRNKGFETNATDPFKALRRLPRPEDLIPASSQQPRDRPRPRPSHPSPSPSLPPVDGAVTPDNPSRGSSSKDGAPGDSRNQILNQPDDCATTPSLPGCENAKLRSPGHGKKTPPDDISDGYNQLEAPANSTSPTAVGNDSVPSPFAGTSQGSTEMPPETMTGNKTLPSVFKDTISTFVNMTSVSQSTDNKQLSSQEDGSVSTTPKTLKNLSLLSKGVDTTSAVAGADVNNIASDSRGNLSTNSSSSGGLKGLDIDSILPNPIAQDDTMSPATNVENINADINRRSSPFLSKNLGLQKATTPKILAMESNPDSKSMQPVEPIVIQGPKPRSFRPQIPNFQQQPGAFGSQFLNRPQQFNGLPSQNLPAGGGSQFLNRPQQFNGLPSQNLPAGGVPSFGASQSGGVPLVRNPQIGGATPFGNPQFGSGGAPSLGVSQTGGVPSFGSSPFGRTPPFGNPQLGGTPSFRNPQIGGTRFGNPPFGVPFSGIRQALGNVQSVGIPSGNLPSGAFPPFGNLAAFSNVQANGIVPAGNQQSGNLSLVSPHSGGLLPTGNPLTGGVTQFGSLQSGNIPSSGNPLPNSVPFASSGSSGRLSFGNQQPGSTAFTNLQTSGVLLSGNQLSVNNTRPFGNGALSGNQQLGLPFAPSSVGPASLPFQQGGSSNIITGSFPFSGSLFQNGNFPNPSLSPFSSALSQLGRNPEQNQFNVVRNGANPFGTIGNLNPFNSAVSSFGGINRAINQFNPFRIANNQNSFNANPFASRRGFSGSFPGLRGSPSSNLNLVMNFLRNSLLAQVSGTRSGLPRFGASPFRRGSFAGSFPRSSFRPGSSFSSLSREG